MNTQPCQNLREPAGMNKITAKMIKPKQERRTNFSVLGMALLSMP